MAKGKRHPMEGENLPIRNSTAEFLTFARENEANTIAVRFQDEMLWLTLPLIGELFGVAKSTVSEHLSNIYATGELNETATVRKYRTVRQEGNRQEYMQRRELPGKHYRQLIVDYIEEFAGASRQDINEFMIDEIRGELTVEEKTAKITNLLTCLRRNGEIERRGATKNARWFIVDKTRNEKDSQ